MGGCGLFVLLGLGGLCLSFLLWISFEAAWTVICVSVVDRWVSSVLAWFVCFLSFIVYFVFVFFVIVIV